MISRKWQLGFLTAAIVAVMAMPASADLLAHLKCNNVFMSGGWNYTTNEVGGWGDALVNQEGGVPQMTVVTDYPRGRVLQMDANWGALKFPGGEDPSGVTGEFTAMVWAKTYDHGGAGFAPLIMKRPSGWGGTYWQYTVQDVGDKTKIESPLSGPYGDPGSGIFGEWTHYAVTGKFLDPVGEPDLMTVEVFTNGVSQMTPTKMTIIPANANAPICIANTFTDKTHAAIGSLWDEVRFYDVALSESEIQAIMRIPEPSTILMLVMGGLLLLVRRR